MSNTWGIDLQSAIEIKYFCSLICLNHALYIGGWCGGRGLVGVVEMSIDILPLCDLFQIIHLAGNKIFTN